MKHVNSLIVILTFGIFFSLQSSAQSWLITGNSGTNPPTNFIGTTDKNALEFKVNNKLAGYLDWRAALSNTGFGYQVLGSNNGGGNTAFGYQANSSNTNGYQNTAIGNTALYANSTGGYNVAVGLAALFTNRGGSSNTAVGQRSMYLNTTGGNNTATGFNSLYSNTTGNYNIANGDHAGFDNTTGSTNIFIGQYAGIGSNTASNNICIGSHATINSGGTNSVVIGNSVTTASSNVIILGASSQNVGIGTSSPQQQLSVNNALNLDQASANNGVFNNGTPGGDGLIFGSGSGEGIASKRTSGGNQNGLDFYTSFANRMAITNTGNVGIGTTAPYSSTQLTVNGGSRYYSIYAENHNTSGGIAILGTTDQGGGYGIYGSSTGSTSTETNIGVYGVATGSTFQIDPPGSEFTYPANYAVYGDGRYGLAGGFNGSIAVFGDVFSSSDAKLKKNIKQLDNALDRIKQVPVKEFDFDQNVAKQTTLNLPIQHQYGFIAQDIQKIFPNLVAGITAPKIDHSSDPSKSKVTSSTGFLAVNYISFIPVLTKAIQELSAQNDSLKNENAIQQTINADLEARIEKLEKLMNVQPSETTNLKQQTTNISSASLQQNAPNPFNQSTVIRFSVPSTAINAMIIVTDLSGKTVKQFNNLSKGNGTISIEANSLSSGNYMYSLIVDGKRIDTKQMVLTK